MTLSAISDTELSEHRGWITLLNNDWLRKQTCISLAPETETAVCVKMLRRASKRNCLSKEPVLLIKTSEHLPWTNPCRSMKSKHVDQRPLEKDSTTRTWLRGPTALLQQAGQWVQRAASSLHAAVEAECYVNRPRPNGGKSRPSRIRTGSSWGVNPLYSVSKWYLGFNPAKNFSFQVCKLPSKTKFVFLFLKYAYNHLMIHSFVCEGWRKKKKTALETGRHRI